MKPVGYYVCTTNGAFMNSCYFTAKLKAGEKGEPVYTREDLRAWLEARKEHWNGKVIRGICFKETDLINWGGRVNQIEELLAELGQDGRGDALPTRSHRIKAGVPSPKSEEKEELRMVKR